MRLRKGLSLSVGFHRARALEVLKDKLPERKYGISLPLFGNKAEDLRNSSKPFPHKLSSSNSSALQKQVDEISQLWLKHLPVDNRLAELAVLRQARAGSMEYAPGFVGSAGDVAEMIPQHRDDFDWFTDRVDDELSHSHQTK